MAILCILRTQELLTYHLINTQSYSEFCQSQARGNQVTWQAELDQYHRAVEIERQRQEQQRIAKERQQQRERQHNLKLLLQWQEAAFSLGRAASYVERIREFTITKSRKIHNEFKSRVFR